MGWKRLMGRMVTFPFRHAISHIWGPGRAHLRVRRSHGNPKRPIGDIPLHPIIPNTHGIEWVWEGAAFAKAMA